MYDLSVSFIFLSLTHNTSVDMERKPNRFLQIIISIIQKKEHGNYNQEKVTKVL
jgi:hypothetical protein